MMAKNNLYQQCFNHTSQGIAFISTSGKFLQVNPAFVRITGFIEDEWNTMSLSDLWKEGINHLNKNNKPTIIETDTYFNRKDDKIISLHVHCSIVDSTNNNDIFAILTINDNTYTKELESGLSKLKQETAAGEIRFRDLVSSIPGGVYQFERKPDGSYSFPFVSEGAKSFSTNPEKDLENLTNILQRVHPEDLDAVWTSILQSAEEMSVWRHEFRMKKDNGVYIWLRGTSKPQPTKDGGILWTGVMLDITEFKVAHEAVRESQNQFYLFMEQLPAAVNIKNNKGELLFCNTFFASLVGKKPEELIGQKTDKYAPAEYQQQFEKENLEILNNGSSLEFEHTYPINGETTYWLTRKFPIFSDEKRPMLGMISLDISKRKHAEARLTEAKDEAEHIAGKLRLLFENMTDGFSLQEVILNNKGRPHDYRYLEMNKACEEILHINAAEVVGKTHLELNPVNPDQKWKKVFGEVAMTGKSKRIEYYAPKFKKHFRVSSFSPKEGQFANIFEDITERKKMEQELVKAKEKAEQSDRLKSAFLMNMSHEIRTPMNGIIGFSEMFMKENIPCDKRKQYAKIVIANSRQLLGIVNDILDISLIETDGLKLNLEKFSLTNFISDLESFYKKECESKGIALEIHKPRNQEDIVVSDYLRLKQIMTNLLNNALKFTSEGGIKFGYDISDQNIRFFVNDSGIGIAKNHLEVIFDRFVQEEIDFTRRFGGAGLGLSISKKLVHLLGGSLWVDSKKGKGSTFHFTIPFQPGNEIKTQENSISRGSSLTLPLLILVAEDEEINFLYLEELLSEYEIKLIHAENGKEAVEACKTNKDINLVLMDIKMPVMNGYEATKQIKKHRPNLPVIALTAYAMSEDREKALAVGCDDYLAKPLDQDDLMQLILKYAPTTS